MKKILNILLLIFVSYLSINIVNAASTTVETTVDMWAIFGFCGWDTCNVPWGTSWFETMLWWIVKYITYLWGLFGVLMIVVGWIMYAMSWADENLKSTAKTRIKKTLLWLIVLLLGWVILNLIAPWVYY